MFKNIKYHLILLALLPLAITVFSATHAFAAYNNNITSEIHMGGTDVSNQYCAPVDMTNTWASFFNETYPDGELNYKQSWNYNYGQPYKGDTESFAQALRDTLASGNSSGWAVSQNDYQGYYDVDAPQYADSQKSMRIWLFDPSTTFQVHDGYMLASANVRFQDYIFNANAGCRLQASNYNSVSNNYVDTRYDQFLFWASDKMTYNSDVTAPHLPQSATPPEPDTKTYPQFTYTKLGHKLTAKYNDNIEYSGHDLVDLQWLLSKKNADTGEYDQIDTKTTT